MNKVAKNVEGIPVAVSDFEPDMEKFAKDAKRQREEFRKWTPTGRFSLATRDIFAIRRAQIRLGHIRRINDACDLSVDDLKGELHRLIDEL